MRANAKGGNWCILGMLPDGAGQNIFGPIFDLFAQNQNDIDQFVQDMKYAVKYVISFTELLALVVLSTSARGCFFNRSITP